LVVVAVLGYAVAGGTAAPDVKPAAVVEPNVSTARMPKVPVISVDDSIGLPTIKKRSKGITLRFADCDECADVDINTDTKSGRYLAEAVERMAVQVGEAQSVITELRRQLAVAEAGLAAATTELDALTSSMWRAASKAASDRQKSYKDPATAKTRKLQLAARLSYVCSTLLLDEICQ